MMRIFHLAEFERDREITIVLDRRSRIFGDVAVTYSAIPAGDHRSRLLTRVMVAYPGPRFLRPLARRVLPLGDLVMMRKQLRTLKWLAERDAQPSTGHGAVSPQLPWVDEHATVVEADLQDTWEALGSVLGRLLIGRGARGLGRLLRPRTAPPPGDRFRLEKGSTTVGFRVVDADRPARLALEGEHRFSRYALTFRLEEVGPHRSRIRAETHAEFPGASGRLYRALVIGSRAHVVAVRSMLRAVRRTAEG